MASTNHTDRAQAEPDADPNLGQGWPAQVRRRTEELVETSEYPNRTQAFQAAYREVGEGQRRELEDEVLAAANLLDPADTSLGAQQLRETAANITEHRASDAIRQQAVTGTSSSTPDPASPARLAATSSFATPASASLTAGTTAAAGRGGGQAECPASQVTTAAAGATGGTSQRRSR